MTKFLKGFRTVLYNVAAAALPIIADSAPAFDLTPDQEKWYYTVVLMGNILWRAVTDTPIGQAENKKQ